MNKNQRKISILVLALNVSLSSLEHLLHRYTIEPSSKPFDVRSVPVEAVQVEQPKGLIFLTSILMRIGLLFFDRIDINIGVSLPRGGTELKTNREDNYRG